MGVRFVIGRAGTGKTARCHRAIVSIMKADPLGPPIYWIVPKQATFMAERELTCDPELNGFCRAHVLSFEQLGEAILADCGGCAVPQVTSVGRQIVLGHLLRTHASQLRFFNSVARQAGLPAELDATFSEFERCGKTAEDLKTLLFELETSGSDSAQTKAFAAKFHDLHLLYDAYCRYLGQDRLDSHRRLAQVLEYVEQCRLIDGAAIFVDGFSEFTDFERRLLASLGKACADLEITLLLDPASTVVKDPHILPEEMNLFFRTEETYRKLFFAFQSAGISAGPLVFLNESRRFTNPSLAHLEQDGFAPRGRPTKSAGGIRLLVAPDRRAEVDAAARQIQQWRRAGMRLRDIVVLTRNLDTYAELIDASFREHDIRYFNDRRRAAAYHPLPQIVRALFLVALHQFPHDAMMTLLKSGLCGLSLDEADSIENYVIQHRIRGVEWASDEPWRYVRNLTRDSEEELAPAEQYELERIDALRRRIIEPLRGFVARLNGNPKLPAREYIVELYAVLERLGVRTRMTQWLKETTDLEQRAEHEQVWAEVIKLLDQMADVIGTEVVSPVDFLATLESGLEQFDLALTPQTIDQVLVGGVDRTRTPVVRAAIVLGLNESEFPLAPRDQTILSDRERSTLAAHQLEIDPNTLRQLLDENLLSYVAFTRASEELMLTRCAAEDSGKPLAASPFWKRLLDLFPDLSAQEIHRDDASVQTIGTPRQLVTRLMHWAVGPHDDEKNGTAWPALYQWLATHECSSDAIDVMRFRAWRALSYDNRAALSPDIARRLFPSPLVASVSRIETFATCPFKHFARYGLGLNEREDPEVSPLDLGNVYHNILEQLVRQMVESNKTWGADPKNITDRAIQQYALTIGEQLKSELMLSSARNQYLLTHIERTLGLVIDTQNASAAHGRFRPIRSELQFGFDVPESLPPLELKTPAGHLLRLRGVIDRVDLLEDQSAFAVIDYKLSGQTLSLDRVYHGISLQLLTYMLVLQAHGEKLAGRKLTPAAAFYVTLLRRLDDVKHPDEAIAPDDPEFDLQVKPRGLVNRDFLNSFDAEMAPGVDSPVMQVGLKKDGEIKIRKNSDAAEAHEFVALLKHVEQRLVELGDQIIGGTIDIAPYRLNQITPCPNCEYRPVCRFDTLTNRYNNLSVRGRDVVLDSLTSEGEHGE